MDTPEPAPAPRPRLLSDLINPDNIGVAPRRLGGLSGSLLRSRLMAEAAPVPPSLPVTSASTRGARAVPVGRPHAEEADEAGTEEPMPVGRMNLTHAIDGMIDVIADLRGLMDGLEDQCDRLGVPLMGEDSEEDKPHPPETLMEQARDRLSALMELRSRLLRAVRSLEGL